MGDPIGFKEIPRHDRTYAPVSERIKHYREFVLPLPAQELSRQAARCCDCGIPYCHEACPVNNLIPDWNDLVYQQDWKTAFHALDATNNFPEFTGRVCPAPCEASCTLNIVDNPVTIKSIECAIIDRAWEEGWIVPKVPTAKTGKTVAVVGSGPAGLACAQQLARAGHSVVVYEKQKKIGGLLRFGIPDFKMEKHLIDRRIAQMQAEGVEFKPNMHVGKDIKVKALLDKYDALVLAGGAEQPRDLAVPGRELPGTYFAMEFLAQQNARLAKLRVPKNQAISATGKNVVVIGGGDTGSDCVGTSIRQGAKSVLQLEILPRPPEKENKLLTWPLWPLKLRTSTSHEEGCERNWSVATTKLTGEGKVEKLHLVRLEWTQDEAGIWKMTPISGTDFAVDVDLVLLAMGFVHPVHSGMIEQLGVALDSRGNVLADTEDDVNSYQTNLEKVFSCGDMRRGQSLVVWAIREGRQCARSVDYFLMGKSDLPR